MKVGEKKGKVLVVEFGKGMKKMVDEGENGKLGREGKLDGLDVWEGGKVKVKVFGEEKKFGKWEGVVGKLSKVVWEKGGGVSDEEGYMEEVWCGEERVFELLNGGKLKE